jgi:hypothetical protein
MFNFAQNACSASIGFGDRLHPESLFEIAGMRTMRTDQSFPPRSAA